MGIVLYGPRGLPLTEKVGRALRLKGLAFELVEPAGPDDFKRLSPKTGLLPVLEIDGLHVPDSGAILDLLDERFPEPPLVARDARVAREQRRLERWMEDTFAFYMLRWLQGAVDAAALPRLPAGAFPLGPLSKLGVLGANARIRPEALDEGARGPGPEFERRLQDLVKLLGPRPFFFADRIGRADLSVSGSLSVLYRDVYPGARALLASHGTLLAHAERVFAETGGPDPV